MPLKLNPDELPTINLTSMIDVVFLLLIFFMVGTRFSDTESSIAVDLPRVAATGTLAKPSQSKTVNLHRDGGIELDSQRMSLTEVTRALNGIARIDPQVVVFVRPDGSLPIQRLSEVMAAIRQSGVQRISLNSQSSLSR